MNRSALRPDRSARSMSARARAVQIRSLLSITGAASLGGALRNGVELAVRDFGDIHGRAVELGESMDSMCSPDGGRAGAEQISADPQVIGVIGTSCSAAAVEASPLISEAGLVMISPSNTSPLLTSDLAGNANPNYHPGYFRTSNNDLYQANAVADYAYGELGLRRMVAVDDGDPYTTALVSAFGNAFGALGGEVAVSARIDKGDTDMTEVLAEFAAAEPDGIFFPLFEVEGSLFAEQALAFEGLEDATLITGAALLVSEFLATPQSEGMYFAGPESDHGPNVNAATGKNADDVLAAYAATYGGSPTSPYWAHAYDATTVLLRAIKSVAVGARRQIVPRPRRAARGTRRDDWLSGDYRRDLLRRIRRLRHRTHQHLPPHGHEHHGHRAVAGSVPVRAVSPTESRVPFDRSPRKRKYPLRTRRAMSTTCSHRGRGSGYHNRALWKWNF